VSFLVPDFFELLREFNIAFVLPTPPENGLRGRFDRKFRLLPPPWRYSTLYQQLQRPCARLVGDATETVGKGQQRKDAKLVAAKRKSESHDLFVYFDNDAKVAAPFDAQTLVRKMK